MATPVITNATTYMGQYDITGFLNRVGLEYGAEALNDTRMGNETRVHKGGVKTVAFSIGGFADPGAAGMEAIGHGGMGADAAVTCAPLGAAVGSVAYFFRSVTATMQTFGPHGQIMPYSGSAAASGANVALVRGQVFIAASAALTATGSSGVVQLGAVASGQRVHAVAHVLTVSGTSPTLALTVKSAPTSGFAAPTTRLTFTTATAATHELISAPGVITDQYWRVDYTITGTSPSFLVVVAVGIV